MTCGDEGGSEEADCCLTDTEHKKIATEQSVQRSEIKFEDKLFESVFLRPFRFLLKIQFFLPFPEEFQSAKPEPPPLPAEIGRALLLKKSVLRI